MHIVNSHTGPALRLESETDACDGAVSLDLGEAVHLHIAAVLAGTGAASPAAAAEVEAILASLGLRLGDDGVLHHTAPAEVLVHDDAAMRARHAARMDGMARVLGSAS